MVEKDRGEESQMESGAEDKGRWSRKGKEEIFLQKFKFKLFSETVIHAATIEPDLECSSQTAILLTMKKSSKDALSRANVQTWFSTSYLLILKSHLL